MRTAVQLRSETSIQCVLLAGTPAQTRPGRLGPIAIFEPDALVAYVVRTATTPSLSVFRTLAVDDALAATVPGVAPRVRLLVHVHTAGRVRAMRRLFHLITTRRIDPSALSDAFYVRVGAVLSGRPTDAARLRALLGREQNSRARGAAGGGA